MTDIMVDLEGEHMRPVTVVIIEEVKSGDWASAARLFPAPTLKLWQGEVENLPCP